MSSPTPVCRPPLKENISKTPACLYDGILINPTDRFYATAFPPHALWSVIDNYSKYLVSREGEIFSYRSNSYLKVIKTNTDNYMVNMMRDDGKRASKCVHRLVAESFLSNPKKYKFIRRKDGDKANYSFSNLYWSKNHNRYSNSAHANPANLVSKSN